MAAMKEKMRVGIIGGGLMGREAASAFGRWFVLENFPVQVELVAVCDLQEKLLEWFKKVPTVKLLTKDHKELLNSPARRLRAGRRARDGARGRSRAGVVQAARGRRLRLVRRVEGP